MNNWKVDVIIPALNEELSIAQVIADIPSWVRKIIVVDNGSTDQTAEVAKKYGAEVILEPKRGYGAACLKGISILENPDIVVFLDADYSDRPAEMHRLIAPIINGAAEMVIGSRKKGKREKGALTPQAYFGNWLACNLIYLFWQVRYSDLGPFRAITYSSLQNLKMRDQDYGWTVEMQIKAAAKNMKVAEVAVNYHRRIGKSKISGTIKGVIGAGYKILSTIFIFALTKKEKTRKRIILFSKYPVPGKSKTRMIPILGAEKAAQLQKNMTEYIVGNLQKFCREQQHSLEVRFSGGNSETMNNWLGQNILCRPQIAGDLGDKMYDAFAKSFSEGNCSTIITGADCPEVSKDILQLAFHRLKNHDMVLGPAKDGGYYLIGLRKLYPNVFDDISWGTETVFKETIQKAKEAQIDIAILPELSDIDTPKDIEIWNNIIKNNQQNTLEKISIIIPCWNEENYIEDCIQSALKGRNIECIVVDGQSSDLTVAKASSFSEVKVLSSVRGRATQMNFGASHATGDILLFLHADCRLPQNFDQDIRNTLRKKNILGGAFAIKIKNAQGFTMRIEKSINWRSRNMSLPYGDQGIFIWRSAFCKLQGFPSIPILEDFVFVSRLRKISKIPILPNTITTSDRKWRKKGFWKTLLLNQVIVCCYYLGFPHNTLRKWY